MMACIRQRMVGGRLGMLAVGLTVLQAGLASAAFIPVDTFETRTLGAIHGQGDWNGRDSANANDTLGTAAVVAVDPLDASNQTLRRTGTGQAYNSGATLAIPDASSATFFLRFLYENVGTVTLDEAFGLSDVPAPTGALGNFGDFEAQSGVLSPSATPNQLRLRDAGSSQSPTNLINPMTWYNMWMVIDNTNDNWRLLVQSDDDPDFTIQTELFSSTAGNTDIDFRNGVAGNALVMFLTKSSNGAATQSIYFDDLYIDRAGANLAIPVPEPSSLALAVIGCLACWRRFK